MSELDLECFRFDPEASLVAFTVRVCGPKGSATVASCVRAEAGQSREQIHHLIKDRVAALLHAPLPDDGFGEPEPAR